MPPGVWARKHPRKRPDAIRNPSSYPVLKPGSWVEINILEVRPLPGGMLQHFTGKDLVSRWDGVGSTLLEQPVLPGA